ncbi:MAG: CheR family methyltransferase [Roseburia sp.]
MTEEEFVRIYRFLKSRYGIDMSHKKNIMEGRLENHIRVAGFGSYTAYMDALERDYTGGMEKELVNMLSTNHTYFMRESEHLDYLRQVVLPELKEKEAGKKDLCIWCAAASTGQEPYMLAMLLQDFFGLEKKKWDTKILATDISMEALESAKRGIYSGEDIESLPAQWKRRFLKMTHDGRYQITGELKEEVLFRQFNLMNPFPFKRKMHVVFLRNVMIYFDSDTKRQLLDKMYDIMEPGGYLFIGRTETIERGSTGFRMLQPSIFRKPEGKR